MPFNRSAFVNPIPRYGATITMSGGDPIDLENQLRNGTQGFSYEVFSGYI